MRGPLLNINRACQTCHKWPEEELKARVETIQERTLRLRNLAMDALIDLIGDLKSTRAAGKTDPELAAARQSQRRAQFFLDFVEGPRTRRDSTRRRKQPEYSVNRSTFRARGGIARREPEERDPALTITTRRATFAAGQHSTRAIRFQG
ncbi:MAG TPA: ammonia-forming cytochrome c nitrite reductase subunit c552 [Blastocatellia bacterium]|nr:ammonia-forming cytochrome c nitrite reductase subunit c552 [Blastocatellia bacterium]